MSNYPDGFNTDLLKENKRDSIEYEKWLDETFSGFSLSEEEEEKLWIKYKEKLDEKLTE